MNPRLVGLLVGFVLFTGIAVLCLVWPYEVQKYALKCVSGPAARFVPFRGWMESTGYILSIRVVGALALLGAAALVSLALVVRQTVWRWKLFGGAAIVRFLAPFWR